MTAWGRTGRVVLRRNADDSFQGHVDHDVDVDGLFVGEICAWPAQFDGFAVHSEGLIACDNLPSLDAAVMWVLRRAAPDVWREERGPVLKVQRQRTRWGARFWAVVREDASLAAARKTHHAAINRATALAREATR